MDNMNIKIPEPHPLDYGWAFTTDTTTRLVDLLPKHSTCLAMGTPSIALYLEQLGVDVTLVDRQPIQLVKNHLKLDICVDPPIKSLFSSIILDPPWYPEIFVRWLCWAASVSSPDATIVCSMWPESARVSATQERSALIKWLNTWAKVELVHNFLQYEMPLFEQSAIAAQNSSTKWESPRKGDIIIIHKNMTPTLPINSREETIWHRFVFDRYQIALRLRLPCKEFVTIRQHPSVKGWVWPFVSRRAVGRNKIDLWSSRNEVAVVDGATLMLKLLRELGKTGHSGLRANCLGALNPLLEWHLAKLDFRRVLEWNHHE